VDISYCEKPLGSVANFLSRIRERGVRLWARSCELRYEASRGAITHDVVSAIGAAEDEIVALMEHAIASLATEPQLQPRNR